MNFEDLFGFGGGHPHHHRPRKPADTTKFYKILGVSKDADAKTIKRTYRKLCMKHHPDRGGDPEKFKAISKAYDTLSDPDKRKHYDQYGEDAEGRNAPPPKQKPKGKSETFDVSVTLAQLYNGTKKTLKLTRNKLCPDCFGSGTKKGKEGKLQCHKCDGKGVELVVRRMGNMIQQYQRHCQVCGGEGTTIKEEDKCGKCRAKCVIRVRELIDVFVEKGMADGQKIRFPEMADESPDHIPGDVFVRLRLQKHPYLARKGMHMIMQKKITVLEALTGFVFYHTTLDDRKIKVKYDGGCLHHGQVKIIEGEGFPIFESPFERGDLYIEFQIDFPQKVLTDEQKKQVKAALAPLYPPKEIQDVVYTDKAELQDIDAQKERELQRTYMEYKRKREQEEEALNEERGGGRGGPQVQQCQTM